MARPLRLYQAPDPAAELRAVTAELTEALARVAELLPRALAIAADAGAPANAPAQWLRAKQVAPILGLPPHGVMNLYHAGKLRGIRPEGTERVVCFDAADVAAYQQRSRQQSG